MSTDFSKDEFDLETLLVSSGTDLSPMYPFLIHSLKPKEDDPFYRSLYKNYIRLKDGRGDKKMHQMLLSLLNSMYTHKRVVVLLSKRKYRELISKHDFNWGTEGLKWDGRLWRSFIKFLTSNGFRVLNPETKGSSIPFAYELVNLELLKYFQDVDVPAQRKQCLDFICQRASQATASQVPSQEVRVRSTKSASSPYEGRKDSLVRKEKEERGVFDQKNNRVESSSLSGGNQEIQLHDALVKSTDEINYSARYYREVDHYFDWDQFERRLKVQTIELIKTFGKTLDKSVKESNNKKIQDKVIDVIALVPVYGPEILPIQALRDIVTMVAAESPYFKEKYEKRYVKLIGDKYEDAVKQFNSKAKN